MKEWLGVTAVVLGFVGFYAVVAIDADRERKEENVRCAASELCTQRKADRKEVRLSLSTEEIVRAKSGNLYFRGSSCASDCEDLREGFMFAQSVGLTNTDGCKNDSSAFVEGCGIYYDELVESQYDPGDVQDVP